MNNLSVFEAFVLGSLMTAVILPVIQLFFNVSYRKTLLLKSTSSSQWPTPEKLPDGKFYYIVAEAEYNDLNFIRLQMRERTGEEFMKKAVQRFLGWRLPVTFSPDCYVSFDRERAQKNNSWPVGTNILTYDEAETMLQHVLEEL